MEGRPTRWQKAKQDWPGVRGKREVVGGAVGGVLAAIALVLAGAPGAAVEQVIVVFASGVAAAVLIPASELMWAWLQAPMRLLTDDVAAVRREVALLPSQLPSQITSSQPATRIDLDLTLRDAVRRGSEIEQRLRRSPGYSVDDELGVEQWTQSVIEVLAEHGSREMTREFIAASTGEHGIVNKIQARVRALNELVGRLP